VRLGTCIAVELLVGAATLASLVAGSAAGVAELRAYLDRSYDDPVAPLATVREADERTPPATPPDAAAAVAAVVPDAAPVAAAGLAPDRPVPIWMSEGSDDAAVAPLMSGEVVRAKFNRGGSSLSLRLDFDNGARAAFKPEQIHPQSNPRREIAAYRLDRLLGLHRVPPAVGRRFPVATIVKAATGHDRGKLPRLDDEAVKRNGMLRGELSWWIPVIEDAKVAGFKVDQTDGIVTWKRYLRAGATIPERDVGLVRQISDMVAFDFLIDNTDRWSGNNVKVSADRAILYFMDNTMGFTHDMRGHRKSHIYLSRVQTFSRRLVDRLRRLTRDEVAAVMVDAEPFEALVTQRELDALIARRDRLLDYIDDLIAKHGEDKVLAFP
jgi:hypothetical protein